MVRKTNGTNPRRAGKRAEKTNCSSPMQFARWVRKIAAAFQPLHRGLQSAKRARTGDLKGEQERSAAAVLVATGQGAALVRASSPPAGLLPAAAPMPVPPNANKEHACSAEGRRGLKAKASIRRRRPTLKICGSKIYLKIQMDREHKCLPSRKVSN